MKQLKLGNGALEAPQIGLGCMRITGLGTKQAVRELIDTATSTFSTTRTSTPAGRPSASSGRLPAPLCGKK